MSFVVATKLCESVTLYSLQGRRLTIKFFQSATIFLEGKYNIKIVRFEIQTHRSTTNGLGSPHEHVELVTQCVCIYVCMQ